MTVKLPMDPRKMRDGTILVLGVRYERYGDESSSTRPGPLFTYAALKAAGTWWVTGSGHTPQAAGWGAVERWLAKDGRVLVHVNMVTDQKAIWPEPVDSASPVAT